MNHKVKTASLVTYIDQNAARQEMSNEVEVDLCSSNLLVNFECYKNTIYSQENCTFLATLHNVGITPLIDISVYFKIDNALRYVLSSFTINNRHYTIQDLRKGIFLGNLASFQRLHLQFQTKAMQVYEEKDVFAQMIVTYGQYVQDRKIMMDQLSNLVSVKIIPYHV